MTLKPVFYCAMMLLIATPTLAQDGDPLKKHFFPPELVMQHQRDLGLTANQKNTIKKAVQEAQTTFTDANWEIQDAMHAMADLVSGERVDEGEVLNQLETILGLERQIKRAQLTLMVRLKNTLTAEQQEKLRQTSYFSDEGTEGLWPW